MAEINNTSNPQADSYIDTIDIIPFTLTPENRFQSWVARHFDLERRLTSQTMASSDKFLTDFNVAEVLGLDSEESEILFFHFCERQVTQSIHEMEFSIERPSDSGLVLISPLVTPFINAYEEWKKLQVQTHTNIGTHFANVADTLGNFFVMFKVSGLTREQMSLQYEVDKGYYYPDFENEVAVSGDRYERIINARNRLAFLNSLANMLSSAVVTSRNDMNMLEKKMESILARYSSSD